MEAAPDVDDMQSFSSRLPGEHIKHTQLAPIREVSIAGFMFNLVNTPSLYQQLV